MYKSNKRKILISTFLFSLLMIPQLSLASAISLRSSTSVTEPSKTFSLSIYVNPTGTASYTAGVTLKFPADLVSIESFTYAPTWIKMDMAGYDVIDNTTGKLIKTAGYPGGFTTETLLGTAVVKSKKAGSVAISTDKESYVLDIDSNNKLTTYGSFSITSTIKAVTNPNPTTPPVVAKPVVKKPVTPAPVVKETPQVPVVDKTATEPAPLSPAENDKKTKSMVLFFGIIIGAVSSYLGFQ